MAKQGDLFGGDTYDEARDYVRLKGQLDRTWQVMIDGKERTLKMIANETSAKRTDNGRDSEAAISARIRDFRKNKFGSHEVISRNAGGGLWWYRLVPVNAPEPKGYPPIPISSDAAREVQAETNAYYDKQGRFIHEECAVEGCPESPSRSIGYFPRQGKLGLWYCREHWPGTIQT